MLKFSTWNVNGIRAREAQALEWLAQEQPDVLCLQEVKASPEQVPQALREAKGYWSLWHGHKGYSGVALLLRQERFGAAPAFFHPEFNFENRIVAATVGAHTFISVYVPNGGKDFAAKQRFLQALETYIDASHREGNQVLLGGDLNIAREVRDVHEKLRNDEQIGQTAGERRQLEEILGHGTGGRGPAAGPGQRRALHLVGAVAEHAAAEHGLAFGLRAREPGAGRPGEAERRGAGVWHQRSRAGDGDV